MIELKILGRQRRATETSSPLQCSDSFLKPPGAALVAGPNWPAAASLLLNFSSASSSRINPGGGLSGPHNVPLTLSTDRQTHNWMLRCEPVRLAPLGKQQTSSHGATWTNSFSCCGGRLHHFALLLSLLAPSLPLLLLPLPLALLLCPPQPQPQSRPERQPQRLALAALLYFTLALLGLLLARRRRRRLRWAR